MLRKTLVSMGLLSGQGIREVAPRPADPQVLTRFHSARYLQALKQADQGQWDIESLHMGIGTEDVPIFRGMYDYAVLAAGATLVGAELIRSGEVDVAFNPSGGYHHAFSDRAGGFCYINDVVLGCQMLADAGKRVVFLDIDVHHCDGVQAAFYNCSNVMTISTHQDGRTLFPGTGAVNEIGVDEGEGYSINVPLPPGTYDEIYMKAFRAVVLPLLHAFNPDAIVLEVGADTLAGDPLAGLAMTNNAMADVVHLLLAFGKPILTVGGGGYNVDNTVRAWALAWSVLCGDSADDDLIAGMGGVMLESTDWHGGAGLRDRVLVPSQAQRDAVVPPVEEAIERIRERVFPLHGL